MTNTDTKIVLTGFMGVGKSTVARYLSKFLSSENRDLDDFIEKKETRCIAEILNEDGETAFREIETKNLRKILETGARVIALGGGAWTMERNRKIIKQNNYTSVWLEATFEYCWRNIIFSRIERPLAKGKAKTHKLFQERQQIYCLADWHFIVKPDSDARNIAEQIYREVFT